MIPGALCEMQLQAPGRDVIRNPTWGQQSISLGPLQLTGGLSWLCPDPGLCRGASAPEDREASPFQLFLHFSYINRPSLLLWTQQ